MAQCNATIQGISTPAVKFSLHVVELDELLRAHSKTRIRLSPALVASLIQSLVNPSRQLSLTDMKLTTIASGEQIL